MQQSTYKLQKPDMFLHIGSFKSNRLLKLAPYSINQTMIPAPGRRGDHTEQEDLRSCARQRLQGSHRGTIQGGEGRPKNQSCPIHLQHTTPAARAPGNCLLNRMRQVQNRHRQLVSRSERPQRKRRGPADGQFCRSAVHTSKERPRAWLARGNPA